MLKSCFLSDWESHQDDFKALLQKSSDWNKIPLINVIPNHSLRDHQLVRFRGMVQHMFNPEFYMGHYEVENNITKARELRSGRYRDIVQSGADETVLESNTAIIEERQVLYCITTPALNDWVFEQEKKLGEGNAVSDIVLSGPSSTSNLKRQVDDEEPMDQDTVDTSGSCGSDFSTSNSFVPKKISAEKLGGSQDVLASCTGLSLNFPIDGSSGMACIVKIYDSDGLSDLKLNDVIDVVGFISLDPLLAHTSSAVSTDAENLAENPPPSIVPRLHAVALEKLIHVNEMPSDVDEVFQSAKNVRKDLHLVLSQMLLGDTLAADYLICHLVSLVYMRRDGLALGHFSINLSNIPQRPDYTRLLYSVLQRILPKSHYLPMTLDNMNSLSLAPKMDYEANRLSSGLLQLSDNTHLVVDETRLEAGKLDAAGVSNVQALRTLISHQTVNYDFQYYSKPYDADLPVLILSEGKSLLPSNVLVPLKVDSSCLNTLPEIFQAVNHFLKDPLLSAVRLYLCVMRHSCHEFPDDLQKKAQEDFVQMRQSGGLSVSADDLHLLLVLARLVSLSYGEKVVSVEAWEQAKKMETERKERVQHNRSSQASNEP